MTEMLYRCTFCGWSGILSPNEVGHGTRCHSCTTGRLVADPHPTETDWADALDREAAHAAERHQEQTRTEPCDHAETITICNVCLEPLT